MRKKMWAVGVNNSRQIKSQKKFDSALHLQYSYPIIGSLSKLQYQEYTCNNTLQKMSLKIQKYTTSVIWNLYAKKWQQLQMKCVCNYSNMGVSC
jgi:hypothetical protein